MKKKNALVAILLLSMLILMVASSFAENEDVFVFRDGVTFGMSENDVKQIEETKNQLYQEKWFSVDLSGWRIIQYPESVKVSSIKGNIGYFFTNDQMEVAAYDFQGSYNESDYDTIKTALTKVYGESTAIEPMEIVEFMDHFSPGAYTESDVEHPFLWKQDNVNVYLYAYFGGSFGVFYINPEWNYEQSSTEDIVDITGL